MDVLAQDCELRFTELPSVIDWRRSDGGYDPFETFSRNESVDIRVRNDGQEECRYWITASKGRYADATYKRHAFNGIFNLDYWLKVSLSGTNSRVIKDIPDAIDDIML